MERNLPKLPCLISLTELSKRLGISRRTLYHLARTGKIPFYTVGHLMMFDLHDVHQWLRENYHPARS